MDDSIPGESLLGSTEKRARIEGTGSTERNAPTIVADKKGKVEDGELSSKDGSNVPQDNTADFQFPINACNCNKSFREIKNVYSVKKDSTRRRVEIEH